MKKRMLAIALALALSLGLLPARAQAAEIVDSGTCGTNVTWTLDSDGLLTISGTGKMTSYYKGWDSYKASIQSVVIQSGVTTVGASAFNTCENLVSVTLPDSVTDLEQSAFYRCESLTKITLPSGLKSIGVSALRSCDSLTSVTIPNSVTSIGDFAFDGCESLTRISIPDSVKSIGRSAFWYCRSLSAISLPSGITEISDSLLGYTAIQSIVIPNGATKIGDGAFFMCRSLSSVTIPNGVTKIGKNSFYYCDQLSSISIPSSVTTIKEDSFADCIRLRTIYGTSGSAAETYATAHEIQFVALNATVAVTSITLNKNSINLTVGGSAALSATVSPSDATNKKISWTSNNSAVAEVDSSGKVTAKKEGSAVITAKTEDGGKTASCTVTVTAAQSAVTPSPAPSPAVTTVAVTGVKLSETSITVKAGEQKALTATVLPENASNKNIIWSSSDNSVAVVTGGVVTAKGPGTATVTVRTEDGGKTAACTVTVPEVAVTGVTLDRTEATLAFDGYTTLTATVLPENAKNKNVTWSSSNPSVASVDSSGKVTAKQEGTATVTVKTADGGKTAACTVTVLPKPDEDHVHNMVHIALAEPTCTELGNIGYWMCAECGKMFADQKASRELTEEQIVQPALGHTFVDGVCTVCGALDPEAAADAPEVHFARAASYQSQFADVPAGKWYTGVVAEAYELGLMKGTKSNAFNPAGNVTLAEAITMAARVHSIYHTGAERFVETEGKWYQAYLDYAYQNDIIGDNYYTADVNRAATRAQFAEIFARSLPEDGLYPINAIADNALPDVKTSAAYGGYVYTLYRAGVLTGNDAKGTFKPDSYISRAEAAAIVSRMAESNNRIRFSLK